MNPDPSAVSETPPPSRLAKPYRLWLRRSVWLAVAGAALWFGGRWCWGTWQYHHALAAIQTRSFDDALGRLAICRTIWPENAELWFLSAQTSRRAGRFEQAESMLESARRHGLLQRDLKVEQALLTAQQGRYRDVEEFLQERLHPSRSDFPLIAEVVSAEWMRTYRLGPAEHLLTQWIQLQPGDSEPVLRRGWVAEHLFKHEDAIRDYRRALELEPARDPVRLRLIEVLLKARRPQQAAAEAEILLTRPAADPDAILALTRCRREMGELAVARELLERLPSDRKSEPSILAERALLALDQGDLGQAEALFQAALPKLPRERALLYAYQQCLSRQGKNTEAEKVAAQIQESDRDGKRLNEIVGLVTQNPRDADLRYEGGRIFLRNGVVEDGLRWLDMALEADSRHRPTHAFLVEYHESHGDAERARRHRAALERIDAPARTP